VKLVEVLGGLAHADGWTICIQCEISFELFVMALAVFVSGLCQNRQGVDGADTRDLPESGIIWMLAHQFLGAPQYLYAPSDRPSQRILAFLSR
jgi:hypothetical protein